MANRVGQLLGNYELTKLLGKGSFGEVYLGRNIYLDRPVAIKVLHNQIIQDNTDNFFKAARTLAQMNHPHIISVFEFGVENDTAFLIMDYIPGSNLRQMYPLGSRLPLSTVVTYIEQIADALQYLHNQKFIHCDIKPENILLEAKNEIVLSDFGIPISTQESVLHKTLEMIGTPSYIAPEQFMGKPQPASDQYALGIVAYELLTGDHPFHGTVTEITRQHLLAPPPPLRQKVPSLSKDVEEVVLKALAKSPEHRYPSVEAFSRALKVARSLSVAPTMSQQELLQVKDPQIVEKVFVSDETRLSLFSVTHLTIEEDNKALVGKTYSIQVGISQRLVDNQEGKSQQPSSEIPASIPFEISLHPSKNIFLLSEKNQYLHYDPSNLETQLINFEFLITTSGYSNFTIDFYHERRWLRTTQIEFEGIEQEAAVSSEV